VIDLFYWPTPNGKKVSIMLEECALEYKAIPVNIGRGDQFTSEFLDISPNNRIPAIVDRDANISVFESGAILMYLAEKTGRFLPQEIEQRVEVTQWLFWQVGGLGPMAGQLSHFVNYAPEPVPYANTRYEKEYDRLLGVLPTTSSLAAITPLRTWLRSPGSRDTKGSEWTSMFSPTCGVGSTQ